MGDLKRMLDPETVALVGATDREGTLGRVLFENLSRSDRRRLFPVNPRREKVFGLPCYPSVSALPQAPDLAVIAVRAALVPEVLEQCGQAATEGAVIISTGFADAGEEGRRLEERLVRIRAGYGMRIIGPGSFGIIRPEIGLHASILRAHPQPGNIAFIAQSGELGSAVLERGFEAHIGFSIFVSLGSMIDVDFGDLIDFLGNDPATHSILLNMERVVNARKFMSAARGFARSNPIIVMKPGRFALRREHADGDDQVYEAAFKRVGVVRVAEVKDLFDTAQVLDSEYLPAGPRLAVIGNARTIAVMAVDALLGQEGRPAELSPAGVAALVPLQPRQWDGQNPIDLCGDAGIDRYAKTMQVCLKDPGVDGLLVICTALVAAMPPDLAVTIASIAKGTKKPVIVAWMGGQGMEEGMEVLRSHKVPAYATPEEAVRTYMEMFRYKRSLDLLYETPADLSTGRRRPPIRLLKAILRKAMEEGAPELTPQQSANFLTGYGIPMGKALHEAGGEGVDHELYVTMTRDRAFGSVIRFGLGGVARDIFKDCAIGLPPLNQTLAKRLIEESKASAVLSGYGGRKPVDFSGLEQVLIRFSSIVVDFPEIASLAIDPLAVTNGKIRALEAHISLGPLQAVPAGAYPHLVITPYPTRYITPWSLRDGTEVLLRPIRPEDEPTLHHLFYTLSEKTVRERFFSPMKEMTHKMLVRACNIDYDREIAIVAEAGGGDAKRIVGISRLIIEPGSQAEFAVVVHDDYQGKGLGRKLIEVLLAVAQEKGLGKVYGVTLSENDRMLGLLKTLGFTSVRQPGGITGVSRKIQAGQ
jgi:acetyltransferase